MAKSTDGNWYRATILSADDGQIKVQFSDYGNSEVVPKENLRKLDPKFYEPCALALVAGLGLVALRDDALAKLVEWTTEKEVQVTLGFGNDGWLAGLHLDGVDLPMKLVNEKLATPRAADEDPKPEPEAPAEEPASLPAGCTQVYISHIDTPGHFWLQMSDKIDKIEEIQAELQAGAAAYPDVATRDMGTVCVAKYLADDQWYRAEILDSDSDITTVRFIDYGNTDVLDNQPGLIKTIPESLGSLERLAVKSSVNAVPTGTGQWSEPASEFFTRLVGDLSAPVDALIVLKDVVTYVDIFVNGQNLTDKLVSEGYAARSEETDCGGDLPSCFASHVNSPSEFWIQLETATPELQAMEAAMEDAENFPELTDKEEGVICAAKYPEDGAWYRAQVIVDGSEGTEVLFMDYGNASIASELRSLSDELKVKPALSRKCALQKPRDIKSWSRKSEIKFNELAAEGATIFNVQFIASGDISIVELYLEGKSVTEELVGLCEETPELPASERPTPVGQDLHNNGKICYVNSTEEFYVHLDDASADLDKVTDRLAGAAEFEPAAELKVGSVCAAFWDEDEQWYRGRILEFCDNGYHVQFIDYGNKAKCEEFRSLPEDLALIPPLAKCCRLAGVTGDSAKAMLEEFDQTTFQIEFLDSTKEPILVKLSIEGKDISSLLNLESETLQSEQIETQTTKIEPKETNEHTGDKNTQCKTDISEDSKVTESGDCLPALDDKSISDEKKSEPKEETDQKVAASEQVVAKEDVAAKVEVTAEVEVTASKEVAASEEIATNDDDFVDAADELNTSQPDLNESLESTHTVIENKSFDSKDNLSDDIVLANDDGVKDETTSSDKDISSETLENSNDTIKSPEREESRDSNTTDTGYTSGDPEKSPSKESPTKEMQGSPVKSLPENTSETTSEKESVEKGTSEIITEDKTGDKATDNVTKDDVNKEEPTKAQ